MAKIDGKGANLSKGPRGVYEGSGVFKCSGCYSKKLELDQLREENKILRYKLKKLERGAEVIAIGAHTPSSQKVFKEKSSEENTAKRGGAILGHPGKGRKRLNAENADKVIAVPAPEDCPECGMKLSRHSKRERSIFDALERKVCKTLYEIERAKCAGCKKIYESKLPLFPGALYSNALLSQVAVMHYMHGVTIGRICEMFGPSINLSGILGALQRIAKCWESVIDTFIEEFRNAPVRHADETGWRVDGQPGWSWLFCTPTVSIFECQNTRGSKVPKRIFGEKQLSGVLIVDRYSSYNKVPCQLQYCYAHLLREVKKLEVEFPENQEVTTFSADLSHLLSEAMRLASRTLTDKEYYAQAQEIAGQIKALAYKPSKQEGVCNIQQIFQKKEARLYQWAINRDVPAHNNRAERELRQTVIARKVSFGSQSENGAKTRAVMMSVVATAKKRLNGHSVEEWLASALDKLALNPLQKPADLMPPNSV